MYLNKIFIYKLHFICDSDDVWYHVMRASGFIFIQIVSLSDLVRETC